MYTHAKPSQATPQEASLQPGEATAHFDDLRSETTLQRKAQALGDASSGATRSKALQHMADASPTVQNIAQLAVSIQRQGGPEEEELAQGRVQPTMQMKDGAAVNDNRGLEAEADVMGTRANHLGVNITNASLSRSQNSLSSTASPQQVSQCVFVTGSEATADRLEELRKGVKKYYPNDVGVIKAFELLKQGDLSASGGLFSMIFGSSATETLILAGHGSPGKWANYSADIIVNKLRNAGFSNRRFKAIVVAGCHGASLTPSNETLIGNLLAELMKHEDTKNIDVKGVPDVLADHGEAADLSVGNDGRNYELSEITVSKDSQYIPPKYIPQ